MRPGPIQMQSLILIIKIKQKGNPRKTKKLRNRNSEQSYIQTTTDTQQLKHRGLNTQTNKLYKEAWLIRNTWGNSSTRKTTKDYKTWHGSGNN